MFKVEHFKKQERCNPFNQIPDTQTNSFYVDHMQKQSQNYTTSLQHY